MNSTIIWRSALGCATIFFTLTNLQASQEAQRALLELCTEGTHISKELKTYELLSSEGTVKGRQTAFKQPNLVFTVDDLGMTEYLRLHGPHATKLIAQFIGDGAKIDAYDIWGYTPLHVAAENGNIDVCCALIAKGALVNTRSKTDDRYTPLHCAAMKGHWMLCIELLKRGAEVLAKDAAGNTALHKAAEIGCAQTITVLVQQGATIYTKNDREKFPHQLAEENGYDYAQTFGNAHKAKKRETKALQILVKGNGSIKEMQTLLDRGAMLIDKNGQDSDLLTNTVLSGDKDACKLFFKRISLPSLCYSWWFSFATPLIDSITSLSDLEVKLANHNGPQDRDLNSKREQLRQLENDFKKKLLVLERARLRYEVHNRTLTLMLLMRNLALQSLIGEESLEKRKNRVFTAILTLKRLHVSRDLIPKILQSNHCLERDLLTVLYDFYFVSSRANGACPNFQLNFMRAKIASHVPKVLPRILIILPLLNCEAVSDGRDTIDTLLFSELPSEQSRIGNT